jgi:hypothetical protein
VSTPWARMKEWMEFMNDGKPRSGRWTTSGKNPVTQILAMDRTNDPFFSGRPSELEPHRSR